MNDKLKKLKALLLDMQSVLVAYSGGVDSTFLLKIALDTLGKEKVLAVTASSETYPGCEMRDADDLAQNLKANFMIITTNEFSDDNFRKNPKDRCYYCKKELFTKLNQIAKENNLDFVIDGSNADDLSDFRPGAIAKKELGIRSPLQEISFTKQEIRDTSKDLGLKTHDKPSYACLASRIPYGTEITKDILKRIDEGEEFLRSLGFRQLRVRHHGDIVRIEVDKDHIADFLNDDLIDIISKKFESLGYFYVTLDLKGYRTGSMNEVLSEKSIS